MLLSKPLVWESEGRGKGRERQDLFRGLPEVIAGEQRSGAPARKMRGRDGGGDIVTGHRQCPAMSVTLPGTLPVRGSKFPGY